jgi:hypothetical protein
MKFVQTIRDYITKGTNVDRADTTLTTSYVNTGGEIDVRHLKSLKVFIDWTKNASTTGHMKFTELHTSGGTEHPVGYYENVAGALTPVDYEATFSVTGAQEPLILDVSSTSYLKIWGKSTGGSADAKMKIDYIGSNVSATDL